jgi:hypothetical protein
VAHRRRRLERRGRPRNSDARRRATTLADRRAPDDLGSPELRIRKLKAANSSEVPVELADPAGILAAHYMICADELATLRLLTGWLRNVQHVFGLPRGSPDGLWTAILSGNRGAKWAPLNPGGGDAALFRLAQLHVYFGQLDQRDRLALCMGIAAGELWPADRRALRELRAGLQTIASLQKRGRRRMDPPPAAVETAPA